MHRRYTGVFPVVPTTFHEDGSLDLESQKRCLDFMIAAGSNGLCILANFSEQFSLSDEEREVLTVRHLQMLQAVACGTEGITADLCGSCTQALRHDPRRPIADDVESRLLARQG